MNASDRFRAVRFAFTLAVCATGFLANVRADDEFGKRATWKAPVAAEVKAQLDTWLAGRNASDSAKAEITAQWAAAGEAPSAELLERLVVSLAVVDAEAKQVVDFCRGTPTQPALPSFTILKNEQADPLARNNLRLFFGRWLAQHQYYDEALDMIADLEPASVVDPASLLFYQSAGYHRLLSKEKCLPLLVRLLERDKEIPQRYADLARLMQADLEPLKPDSLDEVARLMDEIERRLGHGRAGKKVRDQENDVIAKLDKMIEELEKQQQQQQQQAAANGGGANNPSNPMQDSTPGANKGPGNVDPKKIGEKAGWGNLPPKERQEALQQISKDLPAHYREVIEEYFRKLARDGVD